MPNPQDSCQAIGTLAGWPTEGATTEEVNVQMIDGLSSVFALIYHQAVAVLKPFSLGDQSRGPQKVRVVSNLVDGGNARDGRPCHDDDVHRGLGRDVAECHDVIVFVNDRRGNFASDNALEQRHASRSSLTRSTTASGVIPSSFIT